MSNLISEETKALIAKWSIRHNVTEKEILDYMVSLMDFLGEEKQQGAIFYSHSPTKRRPIQIDFRL